MASRAARHGPLSTRGPLDYSALPNRAKGCLQTKSTSVSISHSAYTSLQRKAGSGCVAVPGGLASASHGGGPVAAASALAAAVSTRPARVLVPMPRGSGIVKPLSSPILHGHPPAAVPRAKSKAILTKKTRKDAPPQHHTRRGDKRVSLEVAADDELFSQHFANYEADMRSAGDTSESNWSTWVELHDAYWTRRGALEMVLPLTPWKIGVVERL